MSNAVQPMVVCLSACELSITSIDIHIIVQEVNEDEC